MIKIILQNKYYSRSNGLKSVLFDSVNKLYNSRVFSFNKIKKKVSNTSTGYSAKLLCIHFRQGMPDPSMTFVSFLTVVNCQPAFAN